eukprot:scaffold117358_cov28-Tisochrysis_lutea.AAC.2
MACTASAEHGDAVAITSSLPTPSSAARNTRVSAVSRLGMRAAPVAADPRMAKHALSVMSERFTSCVSLMRSVACADWSRAHSDPARSTNVRHPLAVLLPPLSVSGSAAAAGSCTPLNALAFG